MGEDRRLTGETGCICGKHSASCSCGIGTAPPSPAMASLTPRSGDALSLRTIHSRPSQVNTGSDENHSARPIQRAEEEDVPPQPSQTYQCLLVFAGFMMTFHVIGINSIYGLFQVRPNSAFIQVSRSPSIYRNSTRLLRQISRTRKGRMLWYPLLGPSAAD